MVKLGQSSDSLSKSHLLLSFRSRRKGNESARYEYTSLDSAERQIRILHLYPGKRNDPVHVDLQTAALKGRDDPSYEALSYTWGSTKSLATVFVGSSHETINITRSLREALLHLRLHDNPRTLWVDALCINQNDLDERGGQVAFMADIYEHASKVIVWLGPESDNSILAIDCIKQIEQNVLVHGDHERVNLTEDFHWADRKSMQDIFSTRQTHALAHFFDMPWFKRLWVWQEVINGDERSILRCGAAVVGWRAVCNAINFFAQLTTPSALTRATKRVINVPSYAGGWDDPSHFWDDLRKFECSDPRDRIYAAFGMLRSRPEFNIEPDYKKPVQEVYTDVASKYLRTSGDLYLLQFVGNPNKLQGLPSWTPDWRVERNTSDFNMAQAGIGPWDSAQCVSISGRTLKVKGKILAHINDPEPCSVSLDSTKQMEKQFTSFVSRLRTKGMICTNAGALARYSSIFWADEFAEACIPTVAFRHSRYHCEALLRKSLGLSEEEGLNQDTIHRAGSYAGKICRGRCFFTSHEGYSGLAPNSAVKDDVVAVLVGCRSAMTLRPLGEGRYSLIGPTWIEGFMTGEAIRGALPANYELIMQSDTRGCIYPAYRHRESGKIQVEDPRLGELPPGWRRVSHKEELFYTRFQYGETGEIGSSIHRDPRLHTDLLEAAGRKFETFELV